MREYLKQLLEKLPEELPEEAETAVRVAVRAAITSGISFDRLSEIRRAEIEGRLLVLPCKVGDTVFVIAHCADVMMNCDDDYETGTGARECPFENDCDFEECDDDNRRIFETTCTGFFIDGTRRDLFVDHINAEFYITDIGKTVFLTLAEAEAALTANNEF